MASTRLRHAFRHMGDDDLADEPEVMDEQEQDALIQTLAEQNKRRNEQFRQLLLGLPVLAMVPFLIACTSPSTSSSPMLPLLGLTSLSATTYLLYRQPPTITGIAVVDAQSHATTASPAAQTSAGRRPSSALYPSTPASAATAFSSTASSPLERHLPLLNGALCVVLLLSLFLPRPAPFTFSSQLVLCSLPAQIYAAVLIAKITMASVNPERELGQLRYNYKGA